MHIHRLIFRILAYPGDKIKRSGVFMAKDAKYIPFPLFLIAGLPAELNEIFHYGIWKFVKSVTYTDLTTVYRQVLYGYYRGSLPAAHCAKFISWLKKKLLSLMKRPMKDRRAPN